MSRTRARATSPWKSLHATTAAARMPGRPKKMQATMPRGCAWPAGTATCGRAVVPGLAVCLPHSTVLDQPPGKECAWPSCPQSGFKALCVYHPKLVSGLLEPLR